MVSKAIGVLLLAGLLGACAGPSLENQPSAEFPGLYAVTSSGFAEAWARQDAALAGYRSIDVQTLDAAHIDIPPNTGMTGTLRSDWKMTPERESGLQKAWADAVARAFSGYAVAPGGPGVLRIAASVTRIAPGRPTATTVGAELQSMTSSRDVVEIWVEIRLYDGSDDRLLAVIRDSRTMASVALSRAAPQTIEMLFKSWAALLHTRVSGR